MLADLRVGDVSMLEQSRVRGKVKAGLVQASGVRADLSPVFGANVL
jgi:hypothetical protein